MGMQSGIPGQQQQFVRNATNSQMQQDWQKPNNNLAPQRVGGAMSSSPIMPNAVSPSVAQTAAKKGPVKAPSVTATAARRKSAKSGSTPSASAPTPATLANAIKTPNSISTPHIPQSQSNKGTPLGNSPHLDNKNPVVEVPLLGEVFGVSSADSKVIKRRELSTSNPEKFFFAALSNLLDLPDGENGQNGSKPAVDGSKALINSPLSPKVPGEWSSDVKPYAITSAFRQVEFIRELTSSDILDECRQMVEQEAIVKKENSVKREREEDNDLELLFGEKKVKTEDVEFERYLYEPVEFEEWKGWINGLQQTNT